MKQVKEYEAILRSISSRKFSPIYALDGDEPFFIDVIANRLEAEVVPEEMRSFNLQILYGKDVKVRDLITACRRFPMMADHQLILVREAQYIHEKELEKLLEYAENPTESTVLVLLLKGKKLNRGTKLGKAIKPFVHFSSNKLRDYEMQPWLDAHLSTLGLKMEHQAMAILLNTAGTDLHRINGEIDKILSSHGDKKVITVSDLEASAGIDRDYNIFEFTEALGNRNMNRALDIASVIGKDKKNFPLQMIIPMVFNYFKRLLVVHEVGGHMQGDLPKALGASPFMAKKYASAARHYHVKELQRNIGVFHEMDLRVKGMGEKQASSYELLREMIVRITS